tara:strand:- start:10355 stop:11365 length:1011 start_codon:yes stop_codon:yes gene_type:complete
MRASKLFLIFVMVLLGTACTDTDYGLVIGTTEKEVVVEYVEVEPEVELWIESFTQVGAFDEMDILWVIDGSCSMNAHHGQLVKGVEAMMNNLPGDVNWRLKMITAGDNTYPVQSTLFPLTRGDDIDDAIDMLNDLPYDGGEAGFGAVQNYIKGDAYAQTWMRNDAALLTVFVSDEPEQSGIDVSDFAWWYEGLRNSVYMASIVNLPAAESICPYTPGPTTIGQEYIDATDYFGGAVVDICNPDWATAVEDATQEIEPIEDWQLFHKPYEKTITVFVENKPFTDWHYKKSENRIYFDVMPLEGELVEIAYAVEEYNSIANHEVTVDVSSSPSNNFSP